MPYHFPEAANHRARKHKQDPYWTLEAQERARDEYLIGCEYFVYLHELVSHDELMADPSFHKKDAGGALTGVMIKCGGCKCNDFVLPPSSSVLPAIDIVASVSLAVLQRRQAATRSGMLPRLA